MKAQILSVSLALVCLLAGSTTSAATQNAWREFKGGGTSFSYPPDFGEAKATTVPAAALASPDDKPDGVWPEHQKITFANSAVTMYVFPTVGSSQRLDPGAFGKQFPTTVDAAKSLGAMLRTRPAKPKNIPFLPWADQSTPIELKVRYTVSGSLSCIRYLASYEQEPTQITSESLVYSMQGLSRNSNKYVAIYAPLKNAAVPLKLTSGKWTAKQFAQFEKSFPSYVADMSKKLNAQPDTSFSPSLADLDKLVVSIKL